MTIHFIEGFEVYSDGARPQLLERQWAVAEADLAVTKSVARFPGGASVRAAWAQNTCRTRQFHVGLSSYTVGLAFRRPTLGHTIALVEMGQTTDYPVRLQLNPTDRIQIIINSVTVLDVPHPSISIAWHYYEMEVNLHSTTGFVRLFVNNVQIGEFTGDTIRGRLSTHHTLQMRSVGDLGGNNIHWTDIYVGSTRLGDCRVITLRPNANGAHRELTPTSPTGDNFSNVNTRNVTDTTFNSSSVVGHRDTYSNPALSGVTDPEIHGIQIAARVAKSDAGVREARLLTRSGGVDHPGPLFAPATSFLFWGQLHTVDPQTGLPWTEANLNAAQFGLEVR